MQSRLLFILVTVIALCQTAEGSSVGRTAGQFVVSPTGAAQYTIPIWAPPGPHGLQPNIALTYNSQSGNGPLGMGWSISGLSVIAQCNSTYAQDPPASGSVNYPARYCLDGNRMRLTSSETLSTYGNASTTYQTEIADFSNITASATMKGIAPMFFTVQRRDGLTFEYGNGGNSQIAANGSAVQWYLDKVTDRAGNTMTITYLAPGANLTGGEVPATISWTPSSHGSSTYIYTMQFTYGSTTIPAKVGYLQASSASPYLNATSLTNVEIAVSGTVVKNYVLNYTASTTTGRKTLTSVTECADSGATNCLLPTAISYKKPAIGIPTVDTLTGSGATNGTTNAVDFNGDGLTDIVFARTSGSTNHWYVQFALANSGGFGSPVDTGVTTNTTDPVLFDDFLAEGRNDFLVLQSGVWYVVRWNGTSFVSTSTGLTLANRQTASPYGPSSIVSADVDGDGLPDLVWEGLDNKLYVTLNTSANGVVSFSATSNSVGGSTSYLGYLFGNNSFSNTSARHLDFDGDGRGDVMYWASGSLTTLMSRGNTPMITNAVITEATLRAFVPINWNDDGCTDIADLSAVHLTSCGGTPSTITLNGGSAIGTTLVALDWDGDGRTDLLSTNSGDLTLYRSTGNGVAAGGDTGLSVLTANTFLVMDANGDGLDDLAYLAPRSSDAINYGYHYFSGLPDLMSSIADGYGNSISPTYGYLTQGGGLYTNYTDAIAGYINYIGPLYVVSETVFSDPSAAPGSTYNQQFSYYGAWMNVQGRGFSGFETMQQYDSRSTQWDNFFNDVKFPYVGILDAHYLSQDQAQTKKIKTNWINRTYTLLDSTPNNQRYFPYINDSFDQLFEVGGAEDAVRVGTVDTTYAFDNYGNVTNTVTTRTDTDPGSPYNGDTWTTNTTNTPDISVPANTAADLAAWCLNMLDNTQVVYSSTLAGSTSVTRFKTFSPDTPTNCRILTAVTEPTANGALYKVTEALTYDSFGNVHTDTVTGANMPSSPASRLTTLNWGTTGQFLTSVTDPSSATTAAAYTSLQSLTFAVPDSVTNPNSLTTSWTYDAFGRKAKETRPDATSTTWTWSTCASFCGWSNSFYQVVQISYQTNGSTMIRTDTNFYDPIDRVTETSGPTITASTANVQNLYNSLGLLVQQSIPRISGSTAYQQTFAYDGLNRLIETERPVKSTSGPTSCNPSTVPPISGCQGTNYAYAGRKLTVTDPNGNTKTTITDVNGWLRQTKDAIGYNITRAFDAAGSLIKVTDSVGNTLLSGTCTGGACYVYGIKPFRISATDADRGAWAYTVDSLGERTGWTDAKGQSFTMTFDALSRPLTRTETGLFTQWTWGSTPASHNVGQLISECTQTVSPCSSTSALYYESRTFDSDGRPSTRAITEISNPGNDPGGVFLFTNTYSSTTGLPSTLTYPISTGAALNIQYAFQNGLLQSVTDTTDTTTTCGSTCTLWTANAMNGFGELTQETLGNGVVINRSYDAVTSWLSGATAGVGGGATLLNQSYLEDDNGNITQRQNKSHLPTTRTSV